MSNSSMSPIWIDKYNPDYEIVKLLIEKNLNLNYKFSYIVGEKVVFVCDNYIFFNLLNIEENYIRPNLILLKTPSKIKDKLFKDMFKIDLKAVKLNNYIVNINGKIKFSISPYKNNKTLFLSLMGANIKEKYNYKYFTLITIKDKEILMPNHELYLNIPIVINTLINVKTNKNYKIISRK